VILFYQHFIMIRSYFILRSANNVSPKVTTAGVYYLSVGFKRSPLLHPSEVIFHGVCVVLLFTYENSVSLIRYEASALADPAGRTLPNNREPMSFYV